MSPDQPRKVSVIVPTCDRPALLKGALASIRALEGDDLRFEILVGDNGSLPETRSVAEDYDAVYLKVDRRGAGAARNAGLRAASGDYLAFLDDDDVWLAPNIRAQLAQLDANPDLEAVTAQAITTDPNLEHHGEPWPAEPPGAGDQLVRRMLSGFFPQIGVLLARSRVRDLVGEFDEALLGGQDLDWQLRIARRRTLGFVPSPCLLFRGRPPGTYNALQLKRVGYDRVVFSRHALPEWRIWRSPLQLLQAYTGSLQHFYWYFFTVAIAQAERGERSLALRAIGGAFLVFPFRALFHLVTRPQFRQALLGTIPAVRAFDPPAA